MKYIFSKVIVTVVLINNFAINKFLDNSIQILNSSNKLDKIEYCILFIDIIIQVYKNFYYQVSNKFLNEFLSLIFIILRDYFKQISFDEDKFIKIFLGYKKLLKWHYSICDYKRSCYCFYLDFIEYYLPKKNRKNM